jgi:hypothetical protein
MWPKAKPSNLEANTKDSNKPVNHCSALTAQTLLLLQLERMILLSKMTGVDKRAQRDRRALGAKHNKSNRGTNDRY